MYIMIIIINHSYKITIGKIKKNDLVLRYFIIYHIYVSRIVHKF